VNCINQITAYPRTARTSFGCFSVVTSIKPLKDVKKTLCAGEILIF